MAVGVITALVYGIPALDGKLEARDAEYALIKQRDKRQEALATWAEAILTKATNAPVIINGTPFTGVLIKDGLAIMYENGSPVKGL